SKSFDFGIIVEDIVDGCIFILNFGLADLRYERTSFSKKTISFNLDCVYLSIYKGDFFSIKTKQGF
ncbi:MAG: hypothetical protein ACKPJ4_02040, partial [Dolichospermum sp.]